MEETKILELELNIEFGRAFVNNSHQQGQKYGIACEVPYSKEQDLHFFIPSCYSVLVGKIR